MAAGENAKIITYAFNKKSSVVRAVLSLVTLDLSKHRVYSFRDYLGLRVLPNSFANIASCARITSSEVFPRGVFCL